MPGGAWVGVGRGGRGANASRVVVGVGVGVGVGAEGRIDEAISIPAGFGISPITDASRATAS